MRLRMLPLTLCSCAVLLGCMPSAEDPEMALEKRLLAFSRQIRCLVCQNETLADSRADLAEDLRARIREQMQAGRTDAEIVDFLTSRYGDFVLFRPALKPLTYLLWFGPFLILSSGGVVLYRALRQRSGMVEIQPLSDEEKRLAERLMARRGRKGA